MKRVFYYLFPIILLLLSGCGAAETLPRQDDGRVVIALLDTGVAPDAVQGEHLLPGHNYVTDTDDTADQINHGTAVASVILGSESAGITAAAPEAWVVPLVIVTKLEGEMKRCDPDTLAQAIRDSIDLYGADIINVSLGIRTDEPVLEAAVAYAEQQGVLVVSAVGNGGPEEPPCYPAAYETVLAVGSCDKNGVESDFSQSGADILAPGEDIWLASRNGKTYGAKGTSYACAFVSAEAAKLLLTSSAQSPQQLRQSLCSNPIYGS